MSSVSKCTSILIFLVTLSQTTYSQTTISGAINSYLQVTAISANQFTATNLSGSISDFQAGKKIMIYQAKGAAITTTNSASYGAITAYNNAGNYEFATVSSISGSNPYVITVMSLANGYTSTDNVQLVSVPQYTDVTVSGTVTATAWSASTGRGGIVALEASGTLTLSANIDVSGQGFAGGTKGTTTTNPCPDVSTYVSSNSALYAAKGEGIAAFASGSQYARGVQANGGGGGNPHNAGGGGGSNSSNGGNGGNGYQGSVSGCTVTPYAAGGLGGNAINYSALTNKIFFGGGGGAGQQNNSNSSNGGAGGGIIVLRAGVIASTCGNTYGFLANGQSASSSNGNDAAGGGGGGGTIVLDVLSYSLSCNITARADGGNGGSVPDANSHGSGGGGGIGVILQVTPSASTNTVFFSTSGTNGKDCPTCSSTGAAPSTPTTAQQSAAIAAVPGTLTVLPIDLLSFTGKAINNNVELNWTTASELNNEFFTVERSDNGIDFYARATVKGAGTSVQLNHYKAHDTNLHARITYYRLKQTDADGRYHYAGIVAVDTRNLVPDGIMIYPNPANNNVTIINNSDHEAILHIYNSRGQVVCQQIAAQYSKIEIDTSPLPSAIYLVEFQRVHDGKRSIQKLIISR